MGHSLIVIVAAGTLLIALAAGVLGARLSVSGLVKAVGVTLEVIGATVLLFVANLAIGATLVLILRRLSYYTTLYEVADIALLVLSLLQALTLQAWRLVRR